MIIKTAMSGKGFITHEDQTKDGLRFNTLVATDAVTYINVTGDASATNEWMKRVQGVEVTQTEVDSVIETQPLSDLAQIRADISALGTTIKADMGLVAVDVKAAIAKQTITIAPKVG
jgi:hypothetical protein